ncbi:hypothetical protein, variant 1 [Exophiala mesophila]|uniref:Uncharacterized protein n=2 Tax=Exophiala mesophila TaxID=212818 RepID=A0A0D1ZI52_EXOME|nr:uncharacterized protein PV10_04753 [Exophiala mesophila]XP_016225119.1 hypothetical protein, variant 1 [Exophiala mesophila]KIV93544.1 hypothetical protein PV10_04753 [Exophiala mesophila]KIV93545.1 hypothetical protein, variant 1 [Exophiala mesophila]
MAEQRAQDVVNQSQSVGDLSPSDAPATTSTPDIKVSGDESGKVEVALAYKENGIHTLSSLKSDDLDDADASVRSDTDTSRADGSVAGDKNPESKTLKKFVTKPVSFAKYSVPKVVATTANSKTADKAASLNSSAPSLTLAGRPRLVAKTTSSLQTQGNPHKTVSPDPMQVWNKNRATPQPSTKHLTDEELKQQYGIHLTSRIQEDGEGKEAKWADIDDDEDDWAPETIEWNDGTKSTLTPAEVTAQAPPNLSSTVPTNQDPKQATVPPKASPPQFTSSVGPNATVLKLGASAERQAQKAATLTSRGPAEKIVLSSTKGLAPAPARSPWAVLPPVDKVSPVIVNPQPSMPPPNRFLSNNAYPQAPPLATAPVPTKEISADDFNRAWRDSSSQPRELYIPNSGRYEAVPDGRRRLSKNDPGFRAAAVLQRPAPPDSHAPAEPSPAFQTHRTSSDSARRRASSTISGGSGQIARRLSMKSNDIVHPVFDNQHGAGDFDQSSVTREDPVSQTQTPAYQPRGQNDYMNAGAQSATDGDLDAQRVQQRALMKENIERARRRKQEEEQRMEAEKQERIKAKLASLGVGPSGGPEKNDENSRTTASRRESEAPTSSTAPAPSHQPASHSPPKPPQPLASGEPQQYGMMKVHPLDSIKKLVASNSRAFDAHKTPTSKTESSHSTEPPAAASQAPAPIVNGVRTLIPDLRHSSGQEGPTGPEASPKVSKPGSAGNDARSGWHDLRPEHRPVQAGNLWGVSNNKALGNGTFDQSLAGYAPQDLSRTSSTGQGWMNGRTPRTGRSPQIQHANHAVPDNRTYSFQSVISQDRGLLAIDSEADSLFPSTTPAPIGPPQPQQTHAPINGYQNGNRSTGLEAWNNFQTVANQQERAESDQIQREIAARREEELRTGIRQGPSYNFNETWKQVQVGDQANQRHLANATQTTIPASNVFGAVGSQPAPDSASRAINGQAGRGSRFFPQQPGGHIGQDRRAVTYSHPEPPRTPSPPPAEEFASHHPAFDHDTDRPVVHFPREKAVVKLPPNMPPTPPSPVDAQATPQPDLQVPLSWAARVSMPPPAPVAMHRSVSTPVAQNASWQERFNGLLGKKSSPVRAHALPTGAALAVTSSSREPLEVHHITLPGASVSLPLESVLELVAEEEEIASTKHVESEEDLFEDREAGSLPTVHFPRDTPELAGPLASPPTIKAPVVDAISTAAYMVSNLFEPRGPPKPQYAIIRLPLSTTGSVKKDIPVRGAQASHGQRRHPSGPPSSTGSYTGKSSRHRGTPRPRQASKAH